MTTVSLSDLSPAARSVLSVLGLAGPGNVLRFFDNGRPGEELSVCRGEGHPSVWPVVSVDGLRSLGASFIRGESMTLLEENGTPTYDEVKVSTAEYFGDPGPFQFEVIEALRADPVSAELDAGLRELSRDARATGTWLFIRT
jgi:hypothetical protein